MPPLHDRQTRRMRLDTLARLRWLTVFGQAAAVLVARYELDLDAPLAICFLFIAPSVWMNLILAMRYRPAHRLSDGGATALLAYDVVQLAALLYLTGGLGNPFAILFLAPVMISAAALPLRFTFALGALVAGAAGLLVLYFRPLPWFLGEDFALPFHYRLTVWLSIALAAVFIGVYATRVAEEGRQLAEALAATELALAGAQHIRELDGLAAAAAHELGTPLGTILVAARELVRALPPGAAEEDAALILRETQRCRAILGRLAYLRRDDGGPLDEIGLVQLLDEAATGRTRPGVAIAVTLDGPTPEPRTRRNPAVAYALGNLVDNAVAFASREVRIDAAWSEAGVRIAIADDGPGFAPERLARVGDPYLGSARRRGEPGLGLGLFIAKTLIERSGGRLDVVNGEGGGAEARIAWPRDVFTTGVAAAPGLVLEEAGAAPRDAAAARTG